MRQRLRYEITLIGLTMTFLFFFFLGHQEVMMSPQDFLRSITPGIPQPEDLGLDNFLTIPADQVDTVYLGVDEDSIFHQLGSGQSLKCFSFKSRLYLLFGSFLADFPAT